MYAQARILRSMQSYHKVMRGYCILQLIQSVHFFGIALFLSVTRTSFFSFVTPATQEEEEKNITDFHLTPDTAL